MHCSLKNTIFNYLFIYLSFSINNYKLLILLPRKGSFVFIKKISTFSNQDTQNDIKRPEKWFRKNVRMDVSRACIEITKNLNVCIS